MKLMLYFRDRNSTKIWFSWSWPQVHRALLASVQPTLHTVLPHSGQPRAWSASWVMVTLGPFLQLSGTPDLCNPLLEPSLGVLFISHWHDFLSLSSLLVFHIDFLLMWLESRLLVSTAAWQITTQGWLISDHHVPTVRPFTSWATSSGLGSHQTFLAYLLNACVVNSSLVCGQLTPSVFIPQIWVYKILAMLNSSLHLLS
jgi:hypothetical protein